MGINVQIGFLITDDTGREWLRSAIEPASSIAGQDFIWFGPDVTLKQAVQQYPVANMCLVFNTPAARFVSDFHTYRQGNRSVSDAEFRCFATPDDLASALLAEDRPQHAAALSVMEAMTSSDSLLSSTLGSPKELERMRSRLLFACSLSELDQRLPELHLALGLTVTTQPVEPSGSPFDTIPLSDEALAALRECWPEEFAINDYLLLHFGGTAGNPVRARLLENRERALELYRAGRSADALPRIDSVLHLKPHDRTMLLLRARALSSVKSDHATETAWRDVLEIEGDNPEALISLARLRYRARDLNEAARFLEAAPHDDPNARRLRLIVAEARGDYSLIGDLVGVNRLAELELGNSEDWRFAVSLRVHEGNPHLAERICRVRIKAGPDADEARLALAGILLRQERLSELEELLDETLAIRNSIALTGMVRAALARRDSEAAAHRLDLLRHHFPTSTAIPNEQAKLDRLREAMKLREPAIETSVAITTLLGVSFCGSTALGSMLGSLPGVAHVGESHRIVKSSTRDEQDIAGAPFDFENHDPAELTPCHHCGPDCEVFDLEFRRQLQAQPENWFFKLAHRARMRHLISGDKQTALELDPLERFSAVLLFRDPVAAFWSNLRRKQDGSRHPGHFDNAGQYAQMWARSYQRLLQVAPDGGKTIHLHWDSFTATPHEHLERLCGLLDLPFASTVLNQRDPEQHAFGGNEDVRTGFSATPESFRVRQERTNGVSEAQQQIIRQHHHVQPVYDTLLKRYRADFDHPEGEQP